MCECLALIAVGHHTLDCRFHVQQHIRVVEASAVQDVESVGRKHACGVDGAHVDLCAGCC